MVELPEEEEVEEGRWKRRQGKNRRRDAMRNINKSKECTRKSERQELLIFARNAGQRLRPDCGTRTQSRIR